MLACSSGARISCAIVESGYVYGSLVDGCITVLESGGTDCVCTIVNTDAS
jgi:hypothetical protein